MKTTLWLPSHFNEKSSFPGLLVFFSSLHMCIVSYSEPISSSHWLYIKMISHMKLWVLQAFWNLPTIKSCGLKIHDTNNNDLSEKLRLCSYTGCREFLNTQYWVWSLGKLEGRLTRHVVHSSPHTAVQITVLHLLMCCSCAHMNEWFSHRMRDYC